MGEPSKLNQTTETILRAAFRVHSELGPGLLESIYESCLAFELAEAGLDVERQKVLPVCYRGTLMGAGYRMDLVVDDRVIVEVKALQTIAPIHKAQLLTYLRLAGHRVGLLLNFNVVRLKHGIVRVVNG